MTARQVVVARGRRSRARGGRLDPLRGGFDPRECLPDAVPVHRATLTNCALPGKALAAKAVNSSARGASAVPEPRLTRGGPSATEAARAESAHFPPSRGAQQESFA